MDASKLGVWEGATNFGANFGSYGVTITTKVAVVLTDCGGWGGTSNWSASLEAGKSGSFATSGK